MIKLRENFSGILSHFRYNCTYPCKRKTKELTTYLSGMVLFHRLHRTCFWERGENERARGGVGNTQRSHCDFRAQCGVMLTQAKELLDHSNAGKGREEVLLWSLQSMGRLIDTLTSDLMRTTQKHTSFVPSYHVCCLLLVFFVLLVKSSQKINTWIINSTLQGWGEH